SIFLVRLFRQANLISEYDYKNDDLSSPAKRLCESASIGGSGPLGARASEGSRLSDGEKISGGGGSAATRDSASAGRKCARRPPAFRPAGLSADPPASISGNSPTY